MAVATAVIISENIANAPRPPQSHVAGLGMNEMKATIEYIAKIVMARLMRKFFILFDLKMSAHRQNRTTLHPIWALVLLCSIVPFNQRHD